MRLSLVPDCVFAGEWTEEELRELIFEHQTGADLGMLSKFLSKPVEQIVHELIYIYFGICCAPQEPSSSNHGQQWNKKDDAVLDAHVSEGRDIAAIARHLRRSPKAICLRLLTKLRVSLPSGVIERLGLDPEEYS